MKFIKALFTVFMLSMTAITTVAPMTALAAGSTTTTEGLFTQTETDYVKNNIMGSIGLPGLIVAALAFFWCVGILFGMKGSLWLPGIIFGLAVSSKYLLQKIMDYFA